MKKRALKIWDSAIIVMSLYIVCEFLIEIVTRFPPEVYPVLEAVDFVLCVLFLADWFYYFYKSENKARFTLYHLPDLISSIPFVQILKPFRIARAVRVVRLLRLVRGFRGARKLIRLFAKNRARSVFSIYMIITAAIYFYGALGIYNFELGANRNIHSFGDAMWMAFTTLTTVGYGDCYPVTMEGRILCAVLIITGMGLFSLMTAEFAAFIIKEVNKYKKN